MVGHTLRYTVSKFGVNWTNSSWDTAIFVPPTPVAVQTHYQNIYLFWPVCFTRCATHGLPGTSSCTTPYVQLGCQWPDARVLPIQVPAWDLDQNLQDQGWGKTWLPALHPGQRGLCHHGQMVPADEMHKNDPAKFLDYIESMLDDEISPWVHVYKLEDITKRSDESIDELVNQICQLAQRAQIGNGSDAAIDSKFNVGWLGWSQMLTLSCANNFWRSAVTRGYHTC